MNRDAPEDAFWRSLSARADAPPVRPRVPLWLATPGERIGSIEPALAQRLVAGGLPVTLSDAGACISAGDVTNADAALARIAAWLRAEAVVSGWRDELLTVGDEHGMPRGRIRVSGWAWAGKARR